MISGSPVAFSTTSTFPIEPGASNVANIIILMTRLRKKAALFHSGL